MNRTHRVFRSLPKLVLTAVALGIGANAALAVGGGGHGGGGHGGGAGHVGAFHGGYGHGYGYGYGYGRGYWGGGYWGGYYGYPYGYWGYPYGFGLGIGLGYGYGYGSGYGGYNNFGYPYYGSGYGYPYYGSPASIYGAPNPAAVDPYYGRVFPYGATAPSAASNLTVLPGAGPAPAPGGAPAPLVPSADTEVTLIVRVPANATVWVNGAKTTQNGARREFTSSGLTPGRSYTFLVRAHWDESDGNAVDNDRRITVQAGERRAIDFGSAPAPAAVPVVANP